MVSPTDISVKIPIVFTFSLVTFSIFLLNYSVYIPENLIPELVFVKTISENIYFYVGKLSSTTYVITSRRLITTKKDVIVPFYTCKQMGSTREVSKKIFILLFLVFFCIMCEYRVIIMLDQVQRSPRLSLSLSQGPPKI